MLVKWRQFLPWAAAIALTLRCGGRTEPSGSRSSLPSSPGTSSSQGPGGSVSQGGVPPTAFASSGNPMRSADPDASGSAPSPIGEMPGEAGSPATSWSPSSAGAADASGCTLPGSSTFLPGNGLCYSQTTEVCEGIRYQVHCSCPQANCVCFGPSTKIVAFPDCPYCPGEAPFGPGKIQPADLFTMCGFPRGGL
jgi:hypothetical protein